MNTSLAYPSGAVKAASHAERPRRSPSRSTGSGRILAIWAAAALPMGALAWLVAPGSTTTSAGPAHVPLVEGPDPHASPLGLIWQFVLVAVLVGREQGTLRWSTTREALWLRSPRSPRSGRVGGRFWLILIPLLARVAVVDGVAHL